MSDWQPIETAPKDGTTVLLYRYCEPWDVFGYGAWEESHSVAGWIAHGFFEPPGNLGLAAPSHWMPLPGPPLPATPALHLEEK